MPPNDTSRPASEGPSPPTIEAGLTSEEARRRLQETGPNEVPEERPQPWRGFARRFWAPVPWMLEAALLLELVSRRYIEGAIILVLLVLNAAISQFQEGKALAALALLRQHLAIQARVHRDGHWQRVPARDLVPGDVLHLRHGDIVPADVVLREGALRIAQAALTGESSVAELGPGDVAFAAVTVVQGEATGVVSATGVRTRYGRTVELVESASTPGHSARTIMRVVQALVAMDLVLTIAVLAYARAAQLPLAEVLPFVLILLLASVPVALPATFTLATALGAMGLAKQGVLVTRLASLEEAASMEVACLDKTGTLTANKLSVHALVPLAGVSEEALLRHAALASDEATQDPLDLAILAAAAGRSVRVPLDQRVGLTPFEPGLKRAEAKVRVGDRLVRIVKGSPQAVLALAGLESARIEPAMAHLAGEGARVLAVAVADGDRWQFQGLIGFQDPPREDSAPLIRNLENLGIRALMLTGDSPETARAIASRVGLSGPICRPDREASEGSGLTACAGFAGVFPEDKFRLIRALQREGHSVGMTGDGVNDAPALRQAEVGIAVASATDVARAAASIVLTRAGLSGVVAAVETSRQIFQRLTTYALNKITKTFELALFLSLGLIVTGTFVITPRHMLLLMLLNDFVTMAIATDRVRPPRWPQHWRVRALAVAALILASFGLLFLAAVFWWGRTVLRLSLPELQTLMFVTLAFSTQGMVYLVRERGHFWHSPPSRWLMTSTALAVWLIWLLASWGGLMAPIASRLIAGVGAMVLIFLCLLDWVKVRVFRRLGLTPMA